MEQSKTYENYPCYTIILSNLVSIAIYFIGAFIIYQVGIIWLSFYIAYVLILEIRLIKNHCVNCYYYGKYCAFGKGKLSALFFKKRNQNKFLDKKFTWKDIMPDILVSLVPLIAGIILLILSFNWLLLFLVVLLFLLTSIGNGFIRGNLACKFCKQREIGCPAEQLFNKKESKN